MAVGFLRGRVPVGRDDMGGTAANRITIGGAGFYGIVPGRSGGAETVALSAAQHAAHAHTDTGYQNSGTPGTNPANTGTSSGNAQTITSDNQGSGSAHQNTQPSQVADWIIRIL